MASVEKNRQSLRTRGIQVLKPHETRYFSQFEHVYITKLNLHVSFLCRNLPKDLETIHQHVEEARYVSGG